jgi:hypothetical protein
MVDITRGDFPLTMTDEASLENAANNCIMSERGQGLNAEIGNPRLFSKLKGRDMAGAICCDSYALMGTISTNFR